MKESFGRFLQGVPTHNQVGHKEHKKVLPGGPGRGVPFNEPGGNQQHCGHNNFDYAAAALFFPVVVMVPMSVMVVVVFVATAVMGLVVVVTAVVVVFVATAVMGVVALFLVAVLMVVLTVLFVMSVALTFGICIMMFFHIWCVFLMQRYGKVSATVLHSFSGGS